MIICIHRVDELDNYFKTQYPGKKDLPYIQQLKGMTREWEADVLWGYLDLPVNRYFIPGLVFIREISLQKIRPLNVMLFRS